MDVLSAVFQPYYTEPRTTRPYAGDMGKWLFKHHISNWSILPDLNAYNKVYIAM